MEGRFTGDAAGIESNETEATLARRAYPRQSPFQAQNEASLIESPGYARTYFVAQRLRQRHPVRP